MTAILRFIKKFIPQTLFKRLQPLYHYALALLGALIYRSPSRKLMVIGITGTKGKTSTAEFVNAIFENAGYKTAVLGTLRFKVGLEDRPNLHKMTMPGRFFVQKFLREAVSAGCQIAVVEMTSEGAKQFRHRFIALDALLVTNISPEHIESHGSYEKYLDAKLSIAQALSRSSKKRRVLVVNADDKELEKFLATPNVDKFTYSLKNAEKYEASGKGVRFLYKGTDITSPLPGVFNIYNMLGAATVAEAFGVQSIFIKNGLESVREVRGRMQKIKTGQDFDVIVDYAHTIDSLTQAYEAYKNVRKICVLGNTGGGRDKWKRPGMAQVADKYCDHIILTNEDPYDEDPQAIVEEMKKAVVKKPVKIILDRREAIRQAISLAKSGDAVFITGKGTDPYIMIENGGKLPWSDAEVAKEELEKINLPC